MQISVAQNGSLILRFVWLSLCSAVLLLFHSSASAMPANASKSPYGSSWVCNKGFSRSGNECVAVVPPANAALNFSGNGWVCNKGYTKEKSGCREMTAVEKSAEAERHRLALAAVQARELQIAAGRHCESEYRSGAEVCLALVDTDLQCDNAIFGNHYQSCNVEISYRLETTYQGSSSIYATFECEAELSYLGKNIFGGSDSDSERKSTTLYAGDSVRGTIELDFSFGVFAEVTRATLDSASCRVKDLNLY